MTFDQDPFQVLKAIIESIPQGFIDPWLPMDPESDTVIRPLKPEEIEAYDELWHLESELRASLRKSLRLMNLLESKRYLFSDNLKLSSERIETAEMRGKFVALRKDFEGVPILVEMDPSCLYSDEDED